MTDHEKRLSEIKRGVYRVLGMVCIQGNIPRTTQKELQETIETALTGCFAAGMMHVREALDNVSDAIVRDVNERLQ